MSVGLKARSQGKHTALKLEISYDHNIQQKKTTHYTPLGSSSSDHLQITHMKSLVPHVSHLNEHVWVSGIQDMGGTSTDANRRTMLPLEISSEHRRRILPTHGSQYSLFVQGRNRPFDRPNESALKISARVQQVA